MSGPLVLTLNMSHAAEMFFALLTGLGFGFVLERAGFGNAHNLVAIFYGRDFRVMRVMFSAILTAMIGLYFLDLFDVLPLSSIGILPTYVLPHLVGGLLLGAGFIIGGYCPGTSLVAAMSGKIDAWLFLGGIFVGSLGYTIIYDVMAPFAESTAMGKILLHEFFHIPSAVMVLVIVLLAVGMLAAVKKIEEKVARYLSKQEVSK